MRRWYGRSARLQADGKGTPADLGCWQPQRATRAHRAEGPRPFDGIFQIFVRRVQPF